MHYPTGTTVKLVRHPAIIGHVPPPYRIAPYLGENSEEVFQNIGYSKEGLKELHEAGVYFTWQDLKSEHNG